MISKAMIAIALMLCATLSENTLGAQERGIVAVKVRSATGDSLPFARLRAKGALKDTVVRVKIDGNANFVLPFGAYHLTVNMIGYKPIERDIEVNRGDIRMEVALERIAQQLAAVDVNANWVGIRGVVGDSGVMRTLDHTIVRTASGDRKVETDSLGRFTIRLDKAEQVVLRFEHDGYRSQTMVVNVEPGKTPDIVALLNPGKERNSVKIDMMDLGRRLDILGVNAFVLSGKELMATHTKDIEDAIMQSGMLARKGLQFTSKVCVLLDGEPQVGRPLSAYRSPGVEFVEVWGGPSSDDTGTLAARWQNRAGGCGPTKQPEVHSIYTVRYVGIWTKR